MAIMVQWSRGMRKYKEQNHLKWRRVRNHHTRKFKRGAGHSMRDRFHLPCTDTNSFAPCKCTSHMTTIVRDDSVLRYTEYKCRRNDNILRILSRQIPSGYKCSQLYGRKIVYGDSIKSSAIKPAMLVYRSGCELRCMNKNCEVIK